MKNLKSEYKDMINSEMPDLWGKISAQLGDNSEGAPIPKHIREYLEMEKNEKPEEIKPEVKQPKRRVHYYKYGTFIAACICIVLLIPLLRTKQYARKDAEMLMAEQSEITYSAKTNETNSIEVEDSDVEEAENYAVENITLTYDDSFETKEGAKWDNAYADATQAAVNLEILGSSRQDTSGESEMIYTAKVLEELQVLELHKNDIIKLKADKDLSEELKENSTYCLEIQKDTIDSTIYLIREIKTNPQKESSK